MTGFFKSIITYHCLKINIPTWLMNKLKENPSVMMPDATEEFTVRKNGKLKKMEFNPALALENAGTVKEFIKKD